MTELLTRAVPVNNSLLTETVLSIIAYWQGQINSSIMNSNNIHKLEYCQEIWHGKIPKECFYLLEDPIPTMQIINHKLKLNDQLKYFARDENNQLVSGNCTFCTINKIIDHSEESYKHLFIEHWTTWQEKEGGEILYFNMQEGKWNFVTLDAFFLVGPQKKEKRQKEWPLLSACARLRAAHTLRSDQNEEHKAVRWGCKRPVKLILFHTAIIASAIIASARTENHLWISSW